MSDISQWYPTAAGNNAQSVPDAAVEDVTTVADLNDCDRTAQAGIRRYYDTMEWRDFGYTIASTAAAAVTFSTDVPLYSAGQRVKLTDDPAGVLYGTITDNTSTVLTIDVDGGTTLTEVTMVEAGFNPTGDPYGTAIGALYFGRRTGVSTSILPLGWSMQEDVSGDEGRYWITHDLLTTNLFVLATVEVSYPGPTSTYACTTNIVSDSIIEVAIKWVLDGGSVTETGANRNFSFMVSQY